MLNMSCYGINLFALLANLVSKGTSANSLIDLFVHNRQAAANGNWQAV